jgi:hypothetical protein
MSVITRLILTSLSVAIAAPLVRAEDEKPKKAAEPGKPIVIQLDASKLPPDVLKQLLQLSKSGGEGKPEKPSAKPEKPSPEKPAAKPEKPAPDQTVKSIRLADAIAIAEKTTKGTVVRAERKGEGADSAFVLDLLDGKGGKMKVALNAAGKPLGDEKKGDKEEGKGKPKGGNEKGEGQGKK